MRVLKAIVTLYLSTAFGVVNSQAADVNISVSYPPLVEVDHVTIPNRPVFEGNFPSTVRITKHLKDKISGNSLTSTCTGSLITKFHVLTAAHCVGVDDTKHELEGYLVHYGSVDIDQQNHVSVHAIAVLKTYEENTSQSDDIAVYELSESVVSDDVSVVTLATERTLKSHSEGKFNDIALTGYGYFSVPDATPPDTDKVCGLVKKRSILSTPSRLNAASLKLGPNGLNGNPIITTNPPCQAPIGGCFGDSGGPLYAAQVRVGRPDQLVQIAVVGGASLKTAADHATFGTLRWDTSQNVICFIDGAETAYSSVISQRVFIETAVSQSDNIDGAKLCFDNGANGCE